MKFGWIAIFVVVLLIASAGVGYAAYSYGRNAGETHALIARANLPQNREFENGAGQGGAKGGLALGNLTAGQVKSVNGNTIELNTATAVLKITVNDQTQFQKTIPGAANDIQPGERITIQGDRSADGSITARFVQIGGGRMGCAQVTGAGSN